MNEMRPTDSARRVLEARYPRRGAHGGVIESPEELFDRVARSIGAAGRRCDGADHTGAYRDLLTSLDLLPNRPTLMNAGAARCRFCASIFHSASKGDPDSEAE